MRRWEVQRESCEKDDYILAERAGGNEEEWGPVIIEVGGKG